jgi:hypothetical protein
MFVAVRRMGQGFQTSNAQLVAPERGLYDMESAIDPILLQVESTFHALVETLGIDDLFDFDKD